MVNFAGGVTGAILVSHIVAVLSGQHRRRKEKDSESTATTQIIQKKGFKKEIKKGEGKRRRRQKPFDGELGQILVYTSNRSGRPDRAQVHFAENAPSFIAARSRSLTVRCAAPQTKKRSRALTVRAESLPRDSSQSRKARPASGGHCQTASRQCHHRRMQTAVTTR